MLSLDRYRSSPILPDMQASTPAPLPDLEMAPTRPPGDTRVVAAMSGGVDSSVVAALLVEAGYDVVGVTLQLYDHGADAPVASRTCCAGQDIYDARRVADRLDIPHYVLDYESRFHQDVIENFADAYVAGETPIPCVRCNQTVKFRDLAAKTRELGAEMLATGHYVRRRPGPQGGPAELHAGASADRDQSYFLFATTPAQLDLLRFPLGGMGKDEVRAHARRFDLAIADKPDSQDICFVPDGDYAALVARLRPDAVIPGEIVDRDGKVLGSHRGIVHYTIGQRRGLGLGGREGGEADPLYVVRLEPKTARVVVGPREALEVTQIRVGEVNWIGGPPLTGPAGPIEVTARLRSTQKPAPATLTLDPGGRATLGMLSPQLGIAPGQAAVFYQGTRVLGGGWIQPA